MISALLSASELIDLFIYRTMLEIVHDRRTF